MGIYSRLSTAKYTSAGFYAKFNVGAYYAQITQRLVEDGKLPKLDVWRYSNEEHVENAPPFLAYSTNWLYFIAKNFNINILDFTAIFNILIFIFMNIIGIVYLYRKFKTIYPSLIFIFLSASLPYIVYMQRFSGYTEECLGVFLIFLISIFEIQRRNDRKSAYIETIFLTLLLLTWQQFHMVLLIIFLSNLFFDKKKLKETLIIFAISMFFSEIITRYVFQSNYSPLNMIYEVTYPLLSQDKNIIKIAMRRGDWAYISWENILDYFSYHGVVIFIFSLMNYFYKKNKNYGEKYLFLGLFFTSILTSIFIKSRYLTIPYLLLFCSFDYEYLVIGNIGNFKKLIKFIFYLTIVSSLGFTIFNYKILINFGYVPVIENKMETTKISDDKSKIILKLKNIGKNQTPDEKSFAGFHVEVFNAKVSSIKVDYPNDVSQIVKKKDARMNDYYWFEIKMNNFNKNNIGEVSFNTKIIDPKKPILIKYRSWIPGFCSLPNRLETMLGLIGDYSGFENSWRNEKCLVRSPSNTDQKEKVCSYKVFAAHSERQEFKCFEQYVK
jgi:hypothetical protein